MTFQQLELCSSVYAFLQDKLTPKEGWVKFLFLVINNPYKVFVAYVIPPSVIGP